MQILIGILIGSVLTFLYVHRTARGSK